MVYKCKECDSSVFNVSFDNYLVCAECNMSIQYLENSDFIKRTYAAD